MGEWREEPIARHPALPSSWNLDCLRLEHPAALQIGPQVPLPAGPRESKAVPEAREACFVRRLQPHHRLRPPLDPDRATDIPRFPGDRHDPSHRLFRRCACLGSRFHHARDRYRVENEMDSYPRPEDYCGLSLPRRRAISNVPRTAQTAADGRGWLGNHGNADEGPWNRRWRDFHDAVVVAFEKRIEWS